MRLIIARRGEKPLLELRYGDRAATGSRAAARTRAAGSDCNSLTAMARRLECCAALDDAQRGIACAEQSLVFVERATAGAPRSQCRPAPSGVPLVREGDARAALSEPAALPQGVADRAPPALSRAEARQVLPDRDLAVFRALLIALPASLLLWAGLGWLVG